MDKLDLELFMSLATTRSINQLSFTYPLSYSTIMKRLQQLEDEVGTKLFTKTSNGTEYTIAGRKFYYFAYKSLLTLNEGIKITQDHFEDTTDVFQFGVTHPVMGLISPILQPMMEKQKHYKHWRIRLNSSIELPMLTSCEVIQMAIVHQNDYLPDNLKSIELFNEPIHLVGPKTNEEIKDPSYLLKDACFIIPQRGYPLRELIEEHVFRALKIRPKQIIEIENFWDIKTLVRAGVGYTLLPRSSLWLDTSQLSIYQIYQNQIRQHFYLIYPERLEEEQNEMIDFITTNFQKQVDFFREQEDLLFI
ncbi:LysR family transcriptional regulator [Alkalihalobacillus sp. 1P02AB]|uniref:LysR family transcriptional regulator n=1 Tax=Alkalihalobacillus sp. 1P02AB TaxID=3132260 RepID=UPI0039A601CA